MDEEVKVADEINVKDGVKGARFNETNSGVPTYHDGAYRSITSISSDDQKRIRFAVKPKHSASETFFYIVIGNKTTFNEDGVYLFFKNTGEICYYDGTTTVLQTWVPRTWYVFDFYNINLTGDSFDIDINGVNKGTNYGFADSETEPKYFEFWGISDYGDCFRLSLAR